MRSMNLLMSQRPTDMNLHHDTFAPVREQIIGIRQTFESPYGPQMLIYGDWTASGRLYGPIEDRIRRELGPFVANTHTETTLSGRLMTLAYHEAKHLIKQEIHAGEEDVLLFTGSGMTAAINKLQRIMGLRIPERSRDYLAAPVLAGSDDSWSHRNPAGLPEARRPVVFITHMEHHSNHTSWLETFADLEIIRPTPDGLVDLTHLGELLDQYRHRQLKIASVTACSNITGIQTPYHDIARIMHEAGGLVFVDFACSGPYVEVNMNPEAPGEYLDAVFFSPHKFLGGPGTPGLLVFKSSLYRNQVPDHPGGGTVTFTNPWKVRRYIEDIEAREDGGTPPFLQAIRAAMAFQLKRDMQPERILQREHVLMDQLFSHLDAIPNLQLLASQHRDRLGILSFTIPGLHYHLAVQLLNDRFGIQTRGGCACAGTYGHYLLGIDEQASAVIDGEVLQGNYMRRPGFVRLSIHPTWLEEEAFIVADAIRQVAEHHEEWAADYTYVPERNEFVHHNAAMRARQAQQVLDWYRPFHQEG